MNPPLPRQFFLPPHDQARADLLGVMATLMLRPTVQLVQAFGAAAGQPETRGPADDDALLEAPWQALLARARDLGAEAVCREHADLFVAPGAPRVDPYACRYLGFGLMDQPLARLRADLSALGLTRRPDAPVTEDHLAALFESMRLLITGADGLRPQTPAAQRAFFTEHVMSWAPACLRDIREASGGGFYAALAELAQAFLDAEDEAFRCLDDEPAELSDEANGNAA